MQRKVSVRRYEKYSTILTALRMEEGTMNQGMQQPLEDGQCHATHPTWSLQKGPQACRAF